MRKAKGKTRRGSQSWTGLVLAIPELLSESMNAILFNRIVLAGDRVPGYMATVP